MSALNKIIKWAQNEIPDWQSDAARRILTQEKLTEKDKNDILQLLKQKHGLINDTSIYLISKPLKSTDISGVPQSSLKLVLKEISDLKNINAIPNGQSIPFGHEGLTVIYGENAVGKSGYARVLKRACKARDSKEKILPNIFQNLSLEPAKAKFKLAINDNNDTIINWEDGKEDDNILSSICVFDSKCGRIIVDENNEALYLPYGAHVFEDLVKLLRHIRGQLENEQPIIEKLEFDDIPNLTKAGKFIDSLNYTTDDQTIKIRTNWEKDDENKLSELKKYIAKIEVDDPRKQAQRIKNIVSRINLFSEKILKIIQDLSEDQIEKCNTIITDFLASQEAYSIVQKQPKEVEPLLGIGEKTWQILYLAAKEYSIGIAYPEKEFPYVDEDSRCVLCMQPLSEEAKDRFIRFKSFMEDTTKKQYDNAKLALKELIEEIEKLAISFLDEYKDVTDELKSQDQSISQVISEVILNLKNRYALTLASLKQKTLIKLSKLGLYPKQEIKKIVEKLNDEAKELEGAIDEEVLNNKKKIKEELEAQKLLSQRKEQILKYVRNLKLNRKYRNSISDTEFRDITLKGKKIITEALTPELCRSLQNELNNFGAHHLKLSFRPSGVKGETRHKIELQGSRVVQNVNLTDILSEGEQHIVAIAGFLAELSISDHLCPIVLDDPVSSLDHIYREKIAERLAKESLKRQVIIFTHDISFLLDLESKAGNLDNVYFCSKTVKRHGNEIGICYNGLPWHVMPVKDRINFLAKELSSFEDLFDSDRNKYNKKAAILYGQLRETWEATIEENLFCKTIRRHHSEIQTLRLKNVTVEDSDYKKIHLAMSKCSKWMYGHNKAEQLDVNRPDSIETKNDIQSLRDFIKKLKVKQKQVGKKRYELLQPLTPNIG